MKLKKFMLTLACMVMVACVSFGFMGCGNTTTLKDAQNYVKGASVDESFTNGIVFNFQLAGTEMSGEMTYDEDGNMKEIHAQYTDEEQSFELWKVDNIVYLDNGEAKLLLTEETLENNEEYAIYRDGLADVTERGDDISIEHVFEMLTEMDMMQDWFDNSKLNITKKENGKITTFDINLKYSYKDEETNQKVNMSFTTSLTFNNKKLTKVVTNTYGDEEGVMYMSYEGFSGTISAPENAEEFVEPSTEIEGE